MKKVISLMLVLVMALPTAGVCAAPWPQWAESSLQWAQERQMDEVFLEAPDMVLNREQTAELFYEAAGRPEVSSDVPFSDVQLYQDAISWAYENQYVKGVGEGLFDPLRSVTRQEFAAMLYRAAGSPAVSGRELEQYQDISSVADWAQEPMLWCVKTGLLSGRSDFTLAPTGDITVAEAVTVLSRRELLPDVSVLSKDLDVLTAQHRPIGSQGEQDAALYLKQRFEEMGYEVTLQPYTDENGKTGSNVIACKQGNREDADIFVLSAHHDSVPTAYGANDNASGVVALLAVAELIKDIPTDTQIRLISFTDEENGKNGSRYYTTTLTAEEKSRIIGDIQLDMLGGLGAVGTGISTTDGTSNWVSDLLQQKNAGLSLFSETASDHTSFQLAGIPSVLLMQNGRGYLYHSAADVAGQLDLYAIAGAVQTAAAAVQEIASPQTGSYRDLAHEQGAGYTYRQTKQNVIYFGSSLKDTQAYIGAPGTLTQQWEVEGNGWTDKFETYLYSMRWFGSETPMNTYYRYRNGFLEGIEIRLAETGFTTQQVRSLICGMYGEPASSEDKEGAFSEHWQDEVYSKYITLTDSEDGCTVTVSNYSTGITNVLASYPVENGEAQISDPHHAAVWSYLCSILPQQSRMKIAQFNLYSDGFSNVLAYTSPIQTDGRTDNSRFSINIDYYDVFDENGARRDWSKLTYTILHEYGHVLLEDETQIDLTIGENTHDPAGFVPGSFRKRFYDQFWAELGDTGVGDYEQNPTNYVSRYGANYFHEDIADTFAVFLLGGKPEANTIAEQKLLFFWAEPEMVALRSTIRTNLGLETGSLPGNPDIPDGPVAVSTMEELTQQIEAAIAVAEQPPAMDISALPPQDDMDIAVKNLYYGVLSEHPEYKYAYDIKAQIGSDGLLNCEISYMPYRTGNYPEGFDGVEISSLTDLISVSREHLSQQSLPIRITNRDLKVDDMSRALQQSGGGYILCSLNRDGTAITFTPQNNLSQQECAAKLEQIDRLADEAIAACVQPDMNQEEKAQALYAYLTENVRYDHRYYSDWANMPYDSTTAYGALADHLAICGGYAQALQVLFEKSGIPCYTVSGKMGAENHMWNIAYLNGKWCYFDPTSDRGRASYGFLYCGVDADALTRYEWNREWIDLLTASAGLFGEPTL